MVSDGDGYCALFDSGTVQCWGLGEFGELGNGQFYNPSGPGGSASPVQVQGVGGNGALSNVASLTSDGNGYGYCALLTSGGVDCWGFGEFGELGNGQFYTAVPNGSATPVPVADTDGSGTLSGVTSLASGGEGYCAVLTSGGVDCWGYGPDGELGNGQYYSSSPNGSALPVQVIDTDGSGLLAGVADLTGDGNGYCAVLTSGAVDCWGAGANGELGNGQFYQGTPDGSATPVPVVDTDGSGALSGVSSLTSDATGAYCAVLTSGAVACWGYGQNGELGNGQVLVRRQLGRPRLGGRHGRQRHALGRLEPDGRRRWLLRPQRGRGRVLGQRHARPTRERAVLGLGHPGPRGRYERSRARSTGVATMTGDGSGSLRPAPHRSGELLGGRAGRETWATASSPTAPPSPSR